MLRTPSAPRVALRRSLHGFTIIELVVVIVVIAILAAISIFAYGAWREASAAKEVQSDLAQIAVAFDSSRQWSDGYPTYTQGATFDGNSTTSGLFKSSDGVTLKYYQGDDHSYCVDGTSKQFSNVSYYVDTIVSKGTPKEGTCLLAYAPGAPQGVILIASIVGTNAIGTVSAATCSVGSPEYQLRSRNTATATAGTWSAYTAWSGTNTYSVPASEGYRYSFQAQVRCKSSGGVVGGVTVSNEASSSRSIITVPSVPVVTTSTAGSVTTWAWPATTTCPVGTTPQYQGYSSASWAYTNGWYGPYVNYTSRTWATTSQGHDHTIQIQTRCQTTHSTGTWSASGSATYITPVDAPGAPTNFTFTVAADRRSIDFGWTHPSACGPSARLEWRRNTFIGTQSPAVGPAYGWTDGSGSIINGDGWSLGEGNWSSHGYWTPTSTMNVAESSGPIPPGYEHAIRIQYLCRNATTGRVSDWGPAVTSPIFRS